MEFGYQGNGDIKVSCENFLSSWGNLRFSYVMKQWKSGLVEMMVYIPSTHTEYIGNLQSCPQYHDGSDYRHNLDGKLDGEKSYEWTVPGTATEFSVTLDGSIYGMDEILGVEVYGNSLPLGIFKDVDEASNLSGGMYNSMILPSIVTEIPDASPRNQSHTFRFQCFGTDA